MGGPATREYDAVVVGAGPNGLAAAIVLQSAGLSTLLVEARATPGGGARSETLTLPGFTHDICSTVHPLALASPFFRTLALERHGLRYIHAPIELAHIIDNDTTVVLERDLERTARRLGRDGRAWYDLMAPFASEFERLLPMILSPLRFPAAPFLMARFGLVGLRSARGLCATWFAEKPARALFAGMAAHAMLPLSNWATASFGLVLGSTGHAVGWPIPRGGSRAIVDALVTVFRGHGGELMLNCKVEHMDQLPRARTYLFDLTPKQFLKVTKGHLPERYRQRLARFRYGPGVFKMDFALSEPIPWTSELARSACTVHLSGTFSEVAAAEDAVHAGKLSTRPFVLVVQPSLFDPTRAPRGMHTAWAYCHVPHGSTVDASALIEGEIERYAPGFRARILGRFTLNAVQMEEHNPNYVGGDINGGTSDLRQLFFRPVVSLDPYATPAPNIFVCSSSTPPGGGVHGMCGYWAARSALVRVFGRRARGIELAEEPLAT